MTVNVLFFGALVEVTKVSSMQINDIANSEEIIEMLHKKFPLLCHYKFSVALNQNFLTDAVPLNNGDELALMPPFAGG
jgi:molybdopterin synthase sulfur carrier subunit